MTAVRKWIKITPDTAVADGVRLFTERKDDEDMLVYAYRQAINDYPKFFKMDGLSRLGFVASELLLADTDARSEPRENRAVVFFGCAGSISNDRNYQNTIKDADNFYPSPAIFVYTLPNIVTGEIAIRNKLYGETSFYVLDEWSPSTMVRTIETTFDSDAATTECICGWVEYRAKGDFEAELLLLTRQQDDGSQKLTEQLLNEIRNKK